MNVIEYKENEDGTATFSLEMTDEENRALIEYAVTKLLEEYIKKEKEVS